MRPLCIEYTPDTETPRNVWDSYRPTWCEKPKIHAATMEGYPCENCGRIAHLEYWTWEDAMPGLPALQLCRACLNHASQWEVTIRNLAAAGQPGDCYPTAPVHILSGLCALRTVPPNGECVDCWEERRHSWVILLHSAGNVVIKMCAHHEQPIVWHHRPPVAVVLSRILAQCNVGPQLRAYYEQWQADYVRPENANPPEASGH